MTVLGKPKSFYLTPGLHIIYSKRRRKQHTCYFYSA